MILTKEQVQEFEAVAKPLIKFLCDNFHPHVNVIVTPTDAKINEGSAKIICNEFIKD